MSSDRLSYYYIFIYFYLEQHGPGIEQAKNDVFTDVSTKKGQQTESDCFILYNYTCIVQ